MKFERDYFQNFITIVCFFMVFFHCWILWAGQSSVASTKKSSQSKGALMSNFRTETGYAYPPQAWFIEINSESIKKIHRKKELYLVRRVREIFKNKYGWLIWADSAGASSYIFFSPSYSDKGLLKCVGVEILTGGEKPSRRTDLICNPDNYDDSLFTEYLVHNIRKPREPFIPDSPRPTANLSDSAKFRLSWEKKLKESYLIKNRGHITGQVLEKKTKEPIIGARVRLLLLDGTSAKMGGISDEKGNFVVLNVPSGIYQVEIRYASTYEKELIRNVKVKKDSINTMNPVYLTEKSFENEPRDWPLYHR